MAGGGGEHALLALTPGVMSELAASLTLLTQLSFSGACERDHAHLCSHP